MIKELSNMLGVSGYETNVINWVLNKLKEFELDQMYTDKVGNLICFRKGVMGDKKVMINAHIDEVGFQVINEFSEGKYRIKPLGNIKTWNAYQQRVSSEDVNGIIRAFDEENLKAHNFENIFLETLDGKKTKAGDVFSFSGNFVETENNYYGKALDNRLACAILIDVIKKNIITKADIYIVFTVQEEIGMRGIRVAKSTIIPDVCINIDTSTECEMNSIVLSNGAGIKISDSMSICTVDAVKWLREIAEKNKVKYQLEVSDCGTSELIITNELDLGTQEVGISIPCKYIHSANSIVNKNDYYECKKLLYAILSNL